MQKLPITAVDRNKLVFIHVLPLQSGKKSTSLVLIFLPNSLVMAKITAKGLYCSFTLGLNICRLCILDGSKYYFASIHIRALLSIDEQCCAWSMPIPSHIQVVQKIKWLQRVKNQSVIVETH